MVQSKSQNGKAGSPSQGEAGLRRKKIRHALGLASWPAYVWRRIPRGPEAPRAVLSILHTGYVFTGAALVLDGVFWLGFDLPGALVFLLAHMLWISLFVSLLILNPGFLERLDGTHLQRLGLANQFTASRLFFLPALVYLLLVEQWKAALAGYVILGLTDVVDGFIARHRGEESKLGWILDPFVDILFHLGILLSLAFAGVLSWWTGGFVVARYTLLLGGVAALYLWKGEIWIQPTPFGKATGFVIVTATSVLIFILGLTGRGSPAIPWIDRLLSILFAAGVVHACIIGWVNFRRPPQGGTAVYRKGWGLSIGRRKPGGAP